MKVEIDLTESDLSLIVDSLKLHGESKSFYCGCNVEQHKSIIEKIEDVKCKVRLKNLEFSKFKERWASNSVD